MSTESKIILYNKQNGTTTEIIDNNSYSNMSKKFLLPDESGKLLTEEKTSLMYLTKDNAESTYRKLEDSYNKAEINNKLNEKLAVSTYNTDKGTFATKTELSNGLNAKANSNDVVNLNGNQTINGVKTFRSPVVVPNATATTHAVNLAQLNTKANQATTYNKSEVNNLVNAKANANATVNLTGNQTINGVKTFTSPVIVSNATADNHAVNLFQIKSKADINYVKKRGGFVNVNFNLAGGQGILIDLNLGINFNVNVQRGVSANMRVINAASNIGQSGEIYVSNGAGVSSFSAPFNFRIAQSGFGANEVFSYLVVSANLVRITRS